MESLRQLPLFSDLSDEALAEVSRAGAFREWEQGEVLVGAPDKGSALHVLLCGSASLVSRTRSGQEVELERFGLGEVFGERTSFGGKPADTRDVVVADEKCRVFTLPRPALESCLARHPAFSLSLVQALSRKVVRLDRRLLTAEEDKSDLYEIVRLKDEDAAASSLDLLGTPFFRHRREQIRSLAESGDSLLLAGEAGVGKQRLGRLLFRLSTRYNRVLLTADLYRAEVAEKPTDLAAERLFFGRSGRDGHEPGLVELSREGTLILLGPERLSPGVQERLFRLIQDQRFPSAGSAGAWAPGPRLLFCSVKDLPTLRREGRLLPGLCEYLEPRVLVVPPLRERRKDIPVLVDYYRRKACAEVGKELAGVAPATLRVLLDHGWPGNESELEETVKRGVVLAGGPLLQPEDIYLDLRRGGDRGRFNLLRFRAVVGALRSPLFPQALQWAVAPLFFVLLAFLLLGPSEPERNVGAVCSWGIGWPLFAVGSFVGARFWCSVCPAGSLGALARRLGSLNRPTPHWVKRNGEWFAPAVAGLVLWLEAAVGLRENPAALGLLVAAVALGSILCSLVFERQFWCTYLCGLGGVMGLFARVSPLELRADRNVCAARCTSHECFTGTEGRPGCPFSLFAPAVRSNRECKLCGGCLRNCQYGAMSLYLGLPGRELWENPEANPATSLFVAGLLGGLLAAMLPPWGDAAGPGLATLLPRPLGAAVALLGLSLLVAGTLLVASAASSRFTRETAGEAFAAWGPSYLPLVVSSFFAFHLHYLVTLGPRLPALLSESLHLEALAGLSWQVAPEVLLSLQRGGVGVGAAWSAVVAVALARSKGAARARGFAAAGCHAACAGTLAWAVQAALTLRFGGEG